MAQTSMATSDIFIKQVAEGIVQIFGLGHVLGIYHGHCKIIARVVGASIIRVLVLHYRPHVIWQVVD